MSLRFVGASLFFFLVNIELTPGSLKVIQIYKKQNVSDNDTVSTKAYLCNKYRLSKLSVIHNY